MSLNVGARRRSLPFATGEYIAPTKQSQATRSFLIDPASRFNIEECKNLPAPAYPRNGAALVANLVACADRSAPVGIPPLVSAGAVATASGAGAELRWKAFRLRPEGDVGKLASFVKWTRLTTKRDSSTPLA